MNYMDIKEFLDAGFLQEANRQFFHPLGLALEVVVEKDGSHSLGGVWDYRSDPEGMVFGEATLDTAEARRKATTVKREHMVHYDARVELLGSVIQHIPSPKSRHCD